MKKTILVFGLLVAMVSCKKDNPQPATPTPTPVVIVPTPDPTPTPSYCETEKVGTLEIENLSNYELIIFVDNQPTCVVDPSSVKTMDYISSGNHVVRAELSTDASIFNTYSVKITNCNTTSITVN